MLFYQRVPSRAAKHDRQIFKNDMRTMQEKINQYISSRWDRLLAFGSLGEAE